MNKGMPLLQAFCDLVLFFSFIYKKHYTLYNIKITSFFVNFLMKCVNQCTYIVNGKINKSIVTNLNNKING